MYYRFRNRPCFKGVRQRVIEKRSYVTLWPLHIQMHGNTHMYIYTTLKLHTKDRKLK